MMGQDMESEIKCNNGLPLVSIITPSYNQGEFIEETIDSVLNQTYPNIEYIIVDGGSTDNTLEILKKYENRIQWISEKDKGQANAINKGILRTKGELIGWINSDDVYERDGIEKLVACWKKHPEADLIYGEGIYIDREGRKVGRYLTEVFTKEKLGKQCIICQPSTLFSRAVIERVGMLNEQYQMGMDYELTIKDNRIYIRFMSGKMFETAGVNKFSLDKDTLYKYYRMLDFSFTLSDKLINLIKNTEYDLGGD